MKSRDPMDKLAELRDRMGLNWVAINESNLSGSTKLTIAPFDDGTVNREELLRKEIPFSFLQAVQKFFPKHQVIVRGLATRSEVEAEKSYFQLANAARD